ncbi:MAG TPA: LamG-like jellyroll fold domain-containing protein [Candidatus Saccharimonadales bacterium]|nr:LamG-like jellyroll fold domain-containing protein [Candidatus Saccharimonadales bacterium]
MGGLTNNPSGRDREGFGYGNTKPRRLDGLHRLIKNPEVHRRAGRFSILALALTILFGLVTSATLPKLTSGQTGAASTNRLWTSGAELNSTTAGVEYDISGTSGGGGNVTIDSAIKRSGNYSYKVVTTASGNVIVGKYFASANQTAPYWARAYIYVPAAPSASPDILMFRDTAAATKISVRLTTAMKLQLRNGEAGTQIGSDSTTTLSTNTWYRIELFTDTTTLAGGVKAELRLDGVSVASTTAATLTTGVARLYWGMTANATTSTIYFDDLAINDGTSRTGNWPGQGKVVAMRPDSAGDNSAWTGTYANVNEVTPDDASGYISSSTSGQLEDLNLQSSASAGIGANDFIKLVAVEQRYTRASASSNSTRVRIKATSGGTVDESASLTDSVTTWHTDKSTTPYIPQLTEYDLPGSSTALWTPATLDTAQIGVNNVTSAGSGTQVSTLWLTVEYMPSFGGRVFSSGFELNSTAANVEWTSFTGSPTIVTSPIRSGTYALQTAASGAQSYAQYNWASSNGSGPFFLRAYIRIQTANNAEFSIMELHDSSDVRRAYVTLTSSNTLQLYDEDGVIGSASSALSTATWYRVELEIDTTAAGGSQTVTARVDGTNFATASNRDISTGVARLAIGNNIGNVGSPSTGQLQFDDVALNQGIGSYENSWPGAGKIIHLNPAGAGDNSAWTNDYNSIKEVTPDDATSFTSATTTGGTMDVTMAASGIGASDVVPLVSVGVRFRTNTATEEDFRVRLKDATGGIPIESTTLQPASTTWVSNSTAAPRNYALTAYTRPESKAFWTQSVLDTAQIGVRDMAGSGQIDVSTLWLLVEYSPGFSGVVYGTDEITPDLSGATVRLEINGTTSYTTTASTDNGSFYFTSPAPTTGDTLVFYLDTNGGISGATYTHYGGASLAINIYTNRLTTRCDNSCSLTNTDINSWSNANDTDIKATMTGSNVAIDNSWKLLVQANTYAPGGAITMNTGGSNTYSGDVEIKSGATLNMAGSALNISGNYTNGGTFTAGANTTTFTSTTTGKTLSGTMTSPSNFNILVFNGSGGAWSFGANSATTSSDLTITAGTVTAPSTTLSIGGNYSNSGTFTHNSGTVTMSATTTGHTLAGTMTTTSAFYNLTFDDGGAGADWTFNNNATASYNFSVNSGTVVLNSQTFIITHDFIEANTAAATVTGGNASITVAHDWNKGSSASMTINACTSVYLTGTGQITGGLTQFCNLTLGYSTKITTINTTRFDIYGTLTFNGGTVDSASNTGSTEIIESGTITPVVFGSATSITGTSWVIHYRPTSTSTITMAGGNYGSWSVATDTQSGNNTTYQLGGALTTTGDFYLSARSGVTGTAFNTQNYALTARSFRFGWATNTYCNPITATLGSSTLTLSNGSSDTFYPDLNCGSHTLTMNTSNLKATGNVRFVNGTGTIAVTANTSTLTMQPPASSTTTFSPNGQSIYNFVINGSASGNVQPDSAVAVAGDLTMTNGVLIGTQNVTVNGNAIGTSGAINLTGGTFEQRVGAAESFGDTTGSQTWTFYNLTFSNSNASTGYTITASAGSSGAMSISNVLTIGKGTDTAVTTLNAGGRVWTLSGTTGAPFVITATYGAFAAGTSTFTYTGDYASGNTTVAATTYYRLIINNVAATETYVLAGTTTTSNDLTITAGTLDVTAGNYALNINNSYSNSGTFAAEAGTVTFGATATGKTLAGTMTGSSSFYNLTFNGTGGGWGFSNDVALLAGGTFEVVHGAVADNGHNLTVGTNVGGGTFTLDNTTGVSYTSSGTPNITVGGDWNDLGNKFSRGTSTVILNGNGIINTGSSANFNNLSVGYTGYTTTLANYVNEYGTLTFNGGTFTNSGSAYTHIYCDVNIAPIVFTAPTTLSGAGRIELDGHTNGVTVTVAGGNYGNWTLYMLTNNHNSITFNLGGGLTTTATFLLEAGGTATGSVFNTQDFSLNASSFTFGAVSYTNSFVANFGGSTVTLTGSLQVASNDGSHTLNMGTNCAINVTGNVTLANGTGTITTSPGTSSTLMMTPAASTTTTYTTNGQHLWNFTISGAASTSTVQMSGVGYVDQDFHVTQGTFNAQNNNMTIGRDFILDNVVGVNYNAGSSTVQVARNWSVTGNRFNYNTSTVTLVPAAGVTATVNNGSSSFYNLTVNGNPTGVVTPSGDIIISNDITITAGTLDMTASNYNLTVGGSWSNTSGVFNARAGVVKLINSSTSTKNIRTNGSSFNNLEQDNGLAGYLKLDEGTGTTANDVSASGNTGTIAGTTPTWTNSVKSNDYYGGSGSDPYGLNFNGIDNYINVAENANLPIFSQVNYSIGMWVKGASGQTDDRIFSEGSSTSVNPLFNIGTNSSGGHADILIRDDNSVIRLNHTLSTGIVFDGTWHHLVWTDSSGTAKLYIDGGLDATNFNYTRSSTTLNRTSIGAVLRSTASAFFTGSIDDVRMYNRVLSASEVADLAAGRSPGSGVSSTEGTYTLQDGLNVTGDLNVRTGMLDVSSSNYDVNVTGNYLNVANFNGRAGTLAMKSTASGKMLRSDPYFYNLTFNGSGGSWTAQNRQVTTKDLNITNGTFDVSTSNYAMTVGGNWTNGGTFTARSDLVTLNGSSQQTLNGTMTGGSAFYDLTITNASGTSDPGCGTSFTPGIIFSASATATHSYTIITPSVKVQYLSGGTYTFANINWNGQAAGTRIQFRPSTTSAWLLAVSGTQTVSYVDVQFSDARTGNQIQSSNGTNVDCGSNQNWLFDSPPNSPTSLLQKKVTGGATIATGGWTNETQVQFTASATDPDNPDTLYLCVEKKLIGVGFANAEDLCGSGVAYSGSPVAVTVTITGQTDASQYHWQARLKDTAALYSSWVSYGGNTDPSDADYGIDTTAPTGGTVYDGTAVGVDSAYNDGSLVAVSANWANFNSNVSGLNYYEYSVGTTAGGTDMVGWTNNSTTTSVTASGLNLHTGVTYYYNVRATDNAGNLGGVVSSDGQFVLPQLSFSLGSNTVTFSNLNNANNRQDTKTTTLTTSTNAYGGYVIGQYTDGLLRNGSTNIPMFSAGSYSSPAAWGSGTCSGTTCGFGYTSNDPTISGSNKFGSGTLFAPYSQTASGDIVADHTDAINGVTGPVSNEVFTITHKVAVDALQPATNYSATIYYVVTGTF